MQLPSPDILAAYPVDFDGRRARWRQLRKNGKSARREDRPNSWFPMTAPDGTEVWPIHPAEGWEGRWSIGPETWKEIKDTNEVKWEKRDYGWGHWSRIVNIDHDFESWTSSSVPSLRFSFNAARRLNIPNHMIVALRWDVLSEEDLKTYSGDSLGSRTYFANHRVYGIIARYALASFLRELLRSVKETRQSLSVRSKKNRSTRQVDQISAFFRRSIVVPSIAREVLAISENDASFRWNATGFTQQDHRNEQESYEIKEGLKSFLGRLSRQLLEEDQDTREFLNQLSSAMGTKESISAQRRMEVIGWGALTVAILSAVVAAYATFGSP